MTAARTVQVAEAGDVPRGDGATAGTADDAAWAAVLARDAAHDGRFVYAVRTTGVYCRPSCPSRRALRGNVAFHATPAAAEAAGYRACRRCYPRDAVAPAAAAVARARAYLEAHATEPVTLDALAREAGLSAHHLQRTFTRLVGVSPKRYAAALRADRLKLELRAGATVSRATYEAGYGASSRVYDAASAHLGMAPAAYRHGGRGEHIRYTTAGSALGRVLVAATVRGVCAVTLGDDDAQLEQALAAEYPNARRERVEVGAEPTEPTPLAAGDADADTLARRALRDWVGAVLAHLTGSAPPLVLPLDAGGTAFQQRVWQALGEIPYGETRSYSQLAHAVGAPRAVRAVASACARNRVALVIPCHRVVRESGALGGYRWGLERKRQLLAHERVAAHQAGEAAAPGEVDGGRIRGSR